MHKEGLVMKSLVVDKKKNILTSKQSVLKKESPMKEVRVQLSSTEKIDQTDRKLTNRKKQVSQNSGALSRNVASKSKLATSVVHKKSTFEAADNKGEVVDLCDDNFINQSFENAKYQSLQLLLNKSNSSFNRA